MKTIKYLSIIILFFGLFSCVKTKKQPIQTNPLEGKTLVQKIQNNNHNIALYTENGKFKVGYNKIFIQISKLDNSIVENANISWKPLMKMTSMSHSCPFSDLNLVDQSKSVFEGYIVFQMASNETEFWDLSFEYTLDGQNFQAHDTVHVSESLFKNIVSFTGSDNVKYLIALVAPQNPKIGLNNMSALLFERASMMSFPTLNNYSINIDPRMPSMGNHNSPNNEHLSQTNGEGLYNGKLSLTMTGYWKINLQLLDKNKNVLKGEDVTPENESSSIFLEIEL
ncbi:MAG TPA: hypothetical protein VLZ83_02445 [Edaphocola sp.]|nr:hypothetical protein [Edaphocola sp.]